VVVLVGVLGTGCFAEAEETDEPLSATTSEVSSGASGNEILSRLGRKVRACTPLTATELAELRALDASLKQSKLEVAVFVKCSVGPSGKLASATVSIAREGGYSTSDGPFKALTLSAGVTGSIPVRFVSASGSVVASESYRTTSQVTFQRSASVSVQGAVKLDAVAGSLTGSVSLSSSGTSTVALSLESAAIPVPVSVCSAPGGKTSVGASVKIESATNASLLRGDIARLVRIDGTNKGLLQADFSAAECVKSRPYADRI
jgi:hypothetical protein